ncbi:MAG: PRC-barrel domain containing protein [Actinobacteria bacterium]|nr:PRC-barrel domain containing protein [Actinomycetota bacterium]
MADLGEPSSYLALEAGAPVYSCDGEELGTVREVRSAPEQDIFDGLVLDAGPLGGPRFVAADQVEEIFERGVLLKRDRAAAESLPEHP